MLFFLGFRKDCGIFGTSKAMPPTTKPKQMTTTTLRTFDGDLYRDGEYSTPLRKRFAWHHREINAGKEVCACLRAGEFAWPGGYRCYFVTSDGAALSFDAVRKHLRSVIDSIRTEANDGWRVIGMECTANCDEPVYCDHTGKLLD